MFDPNGFDFSFCGRMDREAVIAMHKREKDSINVQFASRAGEERSLLTTRVGVEHLKAPAKCDLSKLKSSHKRIFIDRSEQRTHFGSYMVLRTIVDPFKIFALHTVVEDELGGVLRLCLYNFVTPLFVHEDISWAVPFGQKIVLLEPCVKFSVGGMTVLRCDNPSHVVLLDDADPFLADVNWPSRPVPRYYKSGAMGHASSFKNRGNDLFRKGAFCEAAASYSKALESLSDESSVDAGELKTTVLSNRSETLLKLGHHRFALRDANAALTLNSLHGKSVLRKIRSLIGMHLFVDARDAVHSGLKVFKEGDLLAELSAYKKQLDLKLTRPSKMDEEDINVLLDSCDWQKNPESRLLWPEYTRKLRVKRSTFAHGRGTFAAERIQQGEIVLLEKALTVVFPNEVKKVVEQPVSYSGILTSSFLNAAAENKTLIDAEKMELIYRICVLSCHIPSINKSLSELAGLPGGQLQDWYTPDTMRTDPVPLPICVDSVETVCSRNALRPDNLHTIRKSLASPEPVKPSKEPDPKKWSPLGAKSIGLWRKAGLINHRCSPNCSQILIGDMLILVALQDIKANDELSINYAPICDSYSQRQLTIERFGFKCVCRRCRREEAHRVKYDRSVDKYFVLDKSLSTRDSDLATLYTSCLALQKSVISITQGRKESLLLASVNDLLLRISTQRRRLQDTTKAAMSQLQPLLCFEHDMHLLPVYQAVPYLLRACGALLSAARQSSLTDNAKADLRRSARDYAQRGIQLARLMLGHSSELVKFVYGEELFAKLMAAGFAERPVTVSEVD
ncbi:uncharacterized protein LOC135808672 [Sycon ciliatum]|uniref:uncharacterized protein LOC135808672 n=1 Tax=Sycon ciliatum TaxID=27933 RepID=UPI0020ABD0AE|eukprot:scpid42146/ scgid12618/ Sperm-associated antigen 1; Infertility-related sperm protein Spag-1; TPR-containing protein involved in spermatogenesis